MVADTLSKYEEYIKSYRITRFNQVNDTYKLALSVIFTDESILVARDYLFSDGNRKYSYHYQGKDKQLIFRYDTAPHWKHLKTAPFHKHTKEGVFESGIMTFNKVVKEITEKFMQTKK